MSMPIESDTWFDVSMQVTMKATYTAGANKGKTRIGIYKFEGDTFTICYSDFGKKEPPADFTGKPGSREIIIVSKRDKP